VKKLLITGASGFLGWNLIQHAKSEWTIIGTFFSHPLKIPGVTLFRVDLTRFKDLKNLFHEARPDAVIHTAAISDPNFCQQNQKNTHKINTEAAINIAGLCADRKIPCLFTSSDLVFDGLNPPYNEKDEPSPVSHYGEQKVLAEQGMKKRYPKIVICRMPLMFGDPGPVAKSFIQPMIRQMKAGIEINLFVDEFRTPVSGKDAAQGLIIALNRMPRVIHLGGSERISRHAFGQLLIDVLQIRDAKLNPCQQKDLNLPAPRPPDVSLDSSKATDLGFRPNPLADELKCLITIH
jgi:dTDP-4-dehydrorhamnose reductase